jgi:putative ABC transport system ATP-binding protein
MTAFIEAHGVHRSYGRGAGLVQAVNGVDLEVAAGEIVALMGPSGCGKSTLLHLIGGLDQPDAGSVRVQGHDWSEFRGAALATRRRETCGFVFQNLMLLPTATAYENIEVPLVLAGVPQAERAPRVNDMLAQVELTDCAAHLPDQLSGGQQQRVGIARALVHRPSLILADEPTGSLDSTTAQVIAELLVTVAREQGAAVVLVTHDPTVGVHGDRIVRLHSGTIDDSATLLATAEERR